jgi:hypothetical protein
MDLKSFGRSFVNYTRAELELPAAELESPRSLRPEYF